MTTPEKIGRYEILSSLGRGGLAVVYRARDPRDRREVALKVLPWEFVEGPSFRVRFEREARAIARLKHRAIVPVYDYGQEGLQFYLAMRLIKGGSLAKRLVEGPLPLEEVTRILESAASALNHAHKKGVIHHNLRTSSVLFDEKGKVYVSDFGIMTLPEVSDQVPPAVLMNVLAYMAPEQIREEVYDGRADIYALGVILFAMLSGELPFRGKSPQELSAQHLSGSVPSVREARAAAGATRPLPSGIGAVVARAMAKEPGKRFGSPGEMARAWRKVVGASGRGGGR